MTRNRGMGGILVAWMVVFAFVSLSGPVLGAEKEAATRGDLAGILKRVHQAVVDGDLAAFGSATVAPKPGMELTPEEFAGAKERMLELFPALDAMEPVKFTLGNTESLVVTRFNLEDQETISLRAYRFQNTDDGWKLLLQFTSKTLTAQNPEADRKAIEHELATLPAFQLAGVEKKKRPDLPSPTVEGLNGRTGAGFLVTGGETYQFDHAVAYKADSGGTPATVVILTDEQLDPEKVKADVKKVGMWNGFKNNVMISFDSANKPQFLWFWVKKDSTSMSAPGFEVVSQVNGEGGKIVGTAMLDALDGQYGTEFFFEVAFNAEVLTP